MYLLNHEPGVFTARLDGIEFSENSEGLVSKVCVCANFTFEDGRKIHEPIRKDEHNFGMNDIGAIFKLTYAKHDGYDGSFVHCDTIEKSPTQELRVVRPRIQVLEEKIKSGDGDATWAVIELIKEQKFTKFCELVDFACEQRAYGLADWLTLNGNFIERYLSSKIRTTL